MTPKEEAKKIYDSIHYGIRVKANGCFKDDGNGFCRINTNMPWESALKISHIICDSIIEETLTEYTNDENHDRVEYWKLVKEELDRI